MSIIIAFLILGIVIIVHELGHFLVAKLNGIVVEEFSVGMGPRIISTRRKDTLYSLRVVPFGGSCMMKGEDEDDTAEGSFNSKSVWGRMAVIVAGPLFNFILAFFGALVIISIIGYDPPTILQVDENSTAWEAGLREGDLLTEFDGHTIDFGRDMSLYEQLYGLDNDTVTLSFLRDGQKHTISYQPDVEHRYLLGISYYQTEEQAEVTVTSGGVAEQAGLASGDIIVGVGDTDISSGLELAEYFALHPLTGDTVTVRYLHDGLEYDAQVTPQETDVVQTGFVYNLYREKTNPVGVLKYSVLEVRYWISATLQSLRMLVTGRLGLDAMSGPVGVVQVIGETYEETKGEGALMTWLTMLNLTILITANLGVMNLLPLPALDGGRLVFLIIEAVRGKPVNREAEAMVHFAGILLLFGLMIFVTFQDVTHLF